MTPQEALAFSAALDPPFQPGINRDLLYVLADALGPRQRAVIVRQLLEQAEAFRNADAPGHRVHYPLHVHAAAAAIRLFGEL